MNQGTVYWVTGLSGAGKTTIGNILYQKIKEKKDNIVILDGDALRNVYGNDLGYTRDERNKGAYRNARISTMLAEQGIDVICCTISMFDDVRTWNRENIKNYVEIYLNVSLEVLKRRDQKGLYSGISSGKTNNVAGADLQVDLPKNSDIVIENDGEQLPAKIADFILKNVEKSK